MKNTFYRKPIRSCLPLILLLSCAAAFAQTEDLGNGFRHHGVATPTSTQRGTVATVDGQGHDVVLSWLFDHRGGYALLLIDVDTGKSEEYPIPFPPGGDTPYASVLSSANKYYSHFNSYFVEFDPAKRAFTFWQQTAPQMAMSMTEDDNGVIWSATYPKSGVVSFDPKTRKLRDYGHVYDQNWNQYPRSIAADDAGWAYFGVGSTSCQIVALNPETGKATPLIPEDKRAHGYSTVYRGVDGKVYGQPVAGKEKNNWHVFYKGVSKPIKEEDRAEEKPIIAGSQGLFHREFPDGKRIQKLDLIDRVLVVEEPKAGTTKDIAFDYTSDGAHVMGLAAAPDNTICGGTAFPMRFFSYDPKKDKWTNREAYGQWNTVARQGDRFFAGGYTGGFLLEWNPFEPWVTTRRDNPDSNPLFLEQSTPTINRPHRLLAHPDGKTIILAGTPDYGYTGGGMLFWDRKTKKSVLLTHTDILPEHSTMSLVALPKGKLLGGSTTSPGTGGEKKAQVAEFYVMDMASKKVEWHEPLLPGAQEYVDMCPAPGGLVYGFADRTRFFVLDPSKRKIVHEQETATAFGLTAYQQGPRVFVTGPKGVVYILFVKGIARVEPKTFKITLLAESPVPATYGGDYLDGRIYFASGSHVYSWEVSR